jgi:2-polyprenyl-3-methyl-5-hydroxy-6-metoxy-1,4-benzoquinol methylase
MSDCIELTACLACGSSNLKKQLDLSKQALANSYVETISDDEPEFPLAVNLCQDCCHLQLTHVVDPKIIYRNYLYVSGTSKTLQDYFEWFAGWTKEYASIWPKNVLDIGCNDGTQLDYFKKIGFDTYGIDPAENLHETSSKNHTVYCDFFGTDITDRLVEQSTKFDIIIAQNSFAHNPDPYQFLSNVRRLMSPTSLLFIQTSQADMIKNDEFDTIYHEHISFYNINSMNRLCRRAGMNLIDVVKAPIHGTSYIFVINTGQAKPRHIENLIAMEAKDRLLDLSRYDEWSDRVQETVKQLIERVHWGREQKYHIIGYGAAAKGNTLLNYGKIKPDVIIDDNPLKRGLYTPGMNVPIVGIDYIKDFEESDPIMFIPLAWNFYSEIKQKIKSKRSSDHDLFVRYFPRVIVEK